MKSSKFYSNICFMLAIVATIFVWCFLLWVIAYPATPANAVEIETVSYFDISALETWCGKPAGTIRMVGAWADGNGYLEDETGNIWEVGADLEEQAFYLLWIDDMRTPQIEDDEILKIWREI